MAGHKGWGATRGSGRLPHGKPFHVPAVDPMVFAMAQQAKQGAKQTGMPVRDFLRHVREAGLAEYDDAQLELIATVAEGTR